MSDEAPMFVLTEQDFPVLTNALNAIRMDNGGPQWPPQSETKIPHRWQPFLKTMEEYAGQLDGSDYSGDDWLDSNFASLCLGEHDDMMEVVGRNPGLSMTHAFLSDFFEAFSYFDDAELPAATRDAQGN